jgi:hypothetical protein
MGSPSPPPIPPIPPLPPPPAPLPAPTIDTAKQQQIQNDQNVARRGRAADLLTGAGGDSSMNTGTKKLLGG